MKFTTIFILIACLHVHAKGFSQQVTLSEKNAPLQKVLKGIEAQTGYVFFYEKALLRNAKAVTIQVKNAKLEEVLDLCFSNQPLIYSIVGTTIVIKPKPSTTAVFQPAEPPIVSSPPPIDIKGRIVNENGEPVEGVSVKIKGTDIGTSTNANGEFTLNNVDENAALVFTGVNIESFETKVSGRKEFALTAKTKVTDLNEVIINKGYYNEKQRFTVGNVATVTAKDIEKQPVQNPLLALQGRIPGIEINQLTGLRGGGITTRIQGQNSISSGLDPLIVIDGVPFATQLPGSTVLEQIVQLGSPLNYINPNDIESIDILKDADATAIYGSRAANGAILITTKKGKAGHTKLSVNIQQGWGKVTRKVDMLNTRQYLDMRYEAYKNDGISISTLAQNSSNRDLTLWDTTRYTDWQKTLIGGTAKYTNMNIGMSGGTAVFNYLVGATYNRQTAVFPGDFDDKVAGLHFNINGSSSNQRLRLQLSGSYSYDNNRLPSIDLTNQAVLMEPNAPPIYQSDGTLNWAPNAAGNSSWINPLAYTLSTEFNNTTKNLISSATISYNILPNLEVRSRVGYTNTLSELWRPLRLEIFTPEFRPTSEREASFGYRNMSSWIIEPQVQYKKHFKNLKIDGLIGTTIQKSSFNYLFVKGLSFPSNSLMKTLTAARTISSEGSSSNENRFNALFGRLNVISNDKYIVNLTVRRDGSNKFGGANKFHNFWSAGGGWIFSEEKWVQNKFRFLSFGKLRGSYGTTGNDQIPDFRYLSIYNINNPTIPYQNSIGFNPNNIPNPYVQWEETRKLQVGVDLGFLHDRLVMGLTYVNNRSSNQLGGYALPSLTGFTIIYKNLPATIQNTSFELSLNTLNLKSKNFSWSTTLNLTIPRNKVVSFPGIDQTSFANGFLGVIVGQPLGIKRVAKYAGMDPANGQHLIIGPSGAPDPSTGKLDVLISTFTNYYAGVENRIEFSGFQLDFLFQLVHKLGYQDLYWWNGARYPGQFSRGSSNQPVTVLNRWQKPGDNASVSRYSTNLYSLSVLSSDAAYNDDASFIRLKNISLSYQLPVTISKKAKLQNARIYANAQNLLTITKYAGLDPETMNFSTLPPLRMITMGIQVEF